MPLLVSDLRLAEDIGKRRNLTKNHPGRVADLRNRLHGWYKARGADFLRAGPRRRAVAAVFQRNEIDEVSEKHVRAIYFADSG